MFSPRLHFLSFLVDTFDLRDMMDGNPRAKGEVKMCSTKRMYTQDNFRHVNQFFGGCYSRVTWMF